MTTRGNRRKNVEAYSISYSDAKWGQEGSRKSVTPPKGKNGKGRANQMMKCGRDFFLTDLWKREDNKQGKLSGFRQSKCHRLHFLSETKTTVSEVNTAKSRCRMRFQGMG